MESENCVLKNHKGDEMVGIASSFRQRRNPRQGRERPGLGQQCPCLGWPHGRLCRAVPRFHGSAGVWVWL